MEFYTTRERGNAPINAKFPFILTKFPIISLILHQTQSGANAGDLNEREWILRVGVGCVYPSVGIVSIIRAYIGLFCPIFGLT